MPSSRTRRPTRRMRARVWTALAGSPRWRPPGARHAGWARPARRPGRARVPPRPATRRGSPRALRRPPTTAAREPARTSARQRAAEVVERREHRLVEVVRAREGPARVQPGRFGSGRGRHVTGLGSSLLFGLRPVGRRRPLDFGVRLGRGRGRDLHAVAARALGHDRGRRPKPRSGPRPAAPPARD